MTFTNEVFKKDFIDDPYAREVTHLEYVCSVDNMTDKELRESIVTDLLVPTMAERTHPEFAGTIKFGIEELVCHLLPNQVTRVIEQLQHEEIKGLIDFRPDGNLRIDGRHEVLQASMDYSGVLYEGFEPVKGVSYLGLNRELISEKGGIEAVCASLAMDIVASSKASDSVQ